MYIPIITIYYYGICCWISSGFCCYVSKLEIELFPCKLFTLKQCGFRYTEHNTHIYLLHIHPYVKYLSVISKTLTRLKSVKKLLSLRILIDFYWMVELVNSICNKLSIRSSLSYNFDYSTNKIQEICTSYSSYHVDIMINYKQRKMKKKTLVKLWYKFE